MSNAKTLHDWINHVTKKANTSLHFISRNLKHCLRKARDIACCSITPSSLEYFSSIWNPRLQKDKATLEKVKWYGVRMVFNWTWWDSSVSTTQFAKYLKWLPHEIRRYHQGMWLANKISHGLVAMPTQRSSCHTSHWPSFQRGTFPRPSGLQTGSTFPSLLMCIPSIWMNAGNAMGHSPSLGQLWRKFNSLAIKIQPGLTQLATNCRTPTELCVCFLVAEALPIQSCSSLGSSFSLSGETSSIICSVSTMIPKKIMRTLGQHAIAGDSTKPLYFRMLRNLPPRQSPWPPRPQSHLGI